MTDTDFKLSSLFDTPRKRWRAAKDFAAGLLASAILIAAAWVLS